MNFCLLSYYIFDKICYNSGGIFPQKPLDTIISECSEESVRRNTVLSNAIRLQAELYFWNLEIISLRDRWKSGKNTGDLFSRIFAKFRQRPDVTPVYKILYFAEVRITTKILRRNSFSHRPYWKFHNILFEKKKNFSQIILQ